FRTALCNYLLVSSSPSLFFFTDPPPPAVSTLSLHDALPIFRIGLVAARRRRARLRRRKTGRRNLRRARADRNEGRPGYQRERVGAALRRAAGKAPSGGGRARSRPSGGLWLANDHRLAVVLAARKIPCAQRQLGCRH